MAVISIALWILFVLLVDVVRHLVQRWRTGDSGLRLRFGRVGSPPWLAVALQLVGGMCCFGAPVIELAGFPALSFLEAMWPRVLGVIVAAVGIVAAFGAQLWMGSSWRIGVDEAERTELVTTGPFRLVRNPIYAAGLLVVIGLTFAVPNVLAFAGFAVVLAGIQVQVRLVEEPHLRRTHGIAYDQYAATVGRFLPRVGRVRPVA
ncbi:methyltransferase family protein [Fodinicola acaciae]|uniref:methyltransferase family protein n=1 Tax=Fodinicola acaciae TaxID=2681555 RepID=UPI0013D8377E|nr:isoprenylcysteine carboxylmethyltransferase family protein [Fodinicola acaciae]